MVNAPSNVYVERKGKLERVAIRFRDNDHIASVAQKMAARVSDAASTNPVRWWIAACRTAAGSTSSSRRWRSTVPASPSANSRVTVRHRRNDRKRLDDPCHRAIAGDRRPVSAQHARLRRHRFRQDDDAQRAQPIHRSQRTHCHHRGCGRVAASAAARDHPGDIGPPASKARGW